VLLRPGSCVHCFITNGANLLYRVLARSTPPSWAIFAVIELPVDLATAHLGPARRRAADTSYICIQSFCRKETDKRFEGRSSGQNAGLGGGGPPARYQAGRQAIGLCWREAAPQTGVDGMPLELYLVHIAGARDLRDALPHWHGAWSRSSER
jgi:hypothetical protein